MRSRSEEEAIETSEEPKDGPRGSGPPGALLAGGATDRHVVVLAILVGSH
jgi:hypothetical protein